MMKLRYIILYVRDVPKTLNFFEKAFNWKRLMIHECGDYGELDTGDTKLAFSSIELMTKLGKKPGISDIKKPVFEIAFETENVRKSLDQALKAGAKLIQDVKDESWGQTTAYVADCNGYLIEICSPIHD